jgi:hypothetical protein
MLRAFSCDHVVFVQGRPLLARTTATICRPLMQPRTNALIHRGRKLEIPRLTDSGYGKRSFQAASLRAVFAPNRPLNDSAFPKSSDS